jgi:DNA repair photolyase
MLMDRRGRAEVVREVAVKSALVRSRLSPYCVNPYAGCAHGCVYCYARFATRFSHPREQWGSFVDVRVNVPEALERQLRRATPAEVYMSSVCDAWQPLEEAYGITRRCLHLLLSAGFPLFLQTKNALIERDLDLLAGRPDVTLGVTVTTMNQAHAGVFEPGASLPAERLRVLRLAKESGLQTFVFLGPLLPGVSDDAESLSELFSCIATAGPDFLLVDRLNRRAGIWNDTRAAAEACAPGLVDVYRRVLFERDESYEAQLRGRVSGIADSFDLLRRIRWCF